MSPSDKLALAQALLARVEARRIRRDDILGVQRLCETSFRFDARMEEELAHERARSADDLAEANRLINEARRESADGI